MVPLCEHFLWHQCLFHLFISVFILSDLVVALAALKSPIAPLASTAGSSLQYCHKVPDIFE